MLSSRLLLSTVFLLAGGPVLAGQAPIAANAPDFPISGRDRVYAAEQFSNTVSVIVDQRESWRHSPRRPAADELVAPLQGSGPCS
jgi:hypothetical protein